MEGKEVAIQKYNAIAKANKTMFIFVAIASVVVSASIVVSIFLAQKIAFKGKVISKQNQTLTAIDNSMKNIEELKNKVKALQSNEALRTSKANDEDNTLRVILDALPAEGNAEAIGSSLTNHILNVPGITIESLSVDPIAAESPTSSTASTSTSPVTSPDGTTNPNAISPKVRTANFSFTVVAGSEKTEGEKKTDESRNARKILTELLEKIERSIRTLNITDFKLEMTSPEKMTLSVSGQAYYLPKYTLQLTQETITSQENAQKGASSSTSTGGKK